jgi:zinc transport system ATP-binding protein
MLLNCREIMTEKPVVEVRDLSFSYNGAPVLEDVNLSVSPRDFVCLVGPNGGGKTTLLKIVLGLLSPSKGHVTVFGKTPEEARLQIGYMPQHSNLDPKFPVSVMDVVLMGRIGHGRVFGRYSKADRKIATEILEWVGLDDLSRTPLSSLSGGQRQRALIARALACQPDLLLLDEPTANLDLHVESQLYGLLQRLNESLTIVLVSHDLGFVTDLVTTVVCVNRTAFLHPTDRLTGDAILDLYGRDVRLVRHDHHCEQSRSHE